MQLEQTIDLFKNEIFKTKSEYHITKLDLEKSKRVADTASQDLQVLTVKYNTLQNKMQDQTQELRESNAKLNAYVSFDGRVGSFKNTSMAQELNPGFD